MKTLLTLCLFLASLSAFAGYPQVYNNGSTISLDYWNNSDRDERCNGTIDIRYNDNSSDYVRVYELAWHRGTIHRTYFAEPGKVIEYINSNVYCF
ncbi:MAG: hypothetical protein ACJ76H_09355 [Bacteriovoracaceae bacterium]